MTTVVEGEVPRDGFSLHYTALGAGEPLLMLAGGPGLNVEYLRPVAEALADRRRCILLHPRGTGRSPLAVSDPSTVNLALCLADVEALRETLGLEGWDVFGHSFGGMWAMAYAAAHPGRVRRLLLAAPGGATPQFFSYYWDNLEARLGPERRAALAFWRDPARLAEDPDRALAEQTRTVAPAFFFHPGHVPSFEAALPGWLAPRAMALMLQSAAADGYDVRHALRALRAPTLIVQGRQDALGEAAALEIHSLLPQASLTFLDRCGHFLWWERPDAFFDALRAALAG